jgi:hypothetical protein
MHGQQNIQKCFSTSYLKLWINPVLNCCSLCGLQALSGISQSSATGWLSYQHVVSTRLLAKGRGFGFGFRDWLIRVGRLSSAPACGDLTSSAHFAPSRPASPRPFPQPYIADTREIPQSSFVGCFAFCVAKLHTLLSPCFGVVSAVTERYKLQG